MQLSRKDRWILANQYRILEALYPDDADHYGRMRTAIENGYEMQYDEAARDIYRDDETMTTDECREVLDILEMYTQMKYAHEKLSDKSGIEEGDIKFWGFDGNEEGKYLSFATYFCEGSGEHDRRYATLNVCNSHGPFLGAYQRMLEEWNRSADKFKLTKDDLIRIKKASIHPENR